MDKNQLRTMIAAILEEMAEATPELKNNLPKKQCVTQSANPQIEDKILADITEIDISKQFMVTNPVDKAGYLKMKAKTPARLGLGRCGPRYKTQSMLRFRADHAGAQDAVFSFVPAELVADMKFVAVSTKCADKDEYVTRPDLGRQFSSEMLAKINSNVKKKQKVQIVVGDGLSSAAIVANVENILPSIQQGLKTLGLSFDEESIIFVKYARVPAMDAIGEVTECDVVCYLIGERPGLVTAESMSAYIAYKPYVGMPEAKRTVISNIHSRGTAAVEAGAYIAEIIAKMLKHKKSGLDLKEVE